MTEDRNFDKLADAFEKRIYGSVKGALRLELLHEDLGALRDGAPMKVFDAGCGLGQMAKWFADAGHGVTACDISEKMLQKAKTQLRDTDVTLHHAPAQAVAPTLPPQDLVLMHAVLEWLADPPATLGTVARAVRPGGHLSLLFFNHHGFVYRNALHGTWRLDYLIDESWIGKGKKLTPPHPQKPEELVRWLEKNGYTVVRRTGIRVFYDFLSEEVLEASDLDKLLTLERKYCREETFRDMGRYIHILAKKRELVSG